MSRILRRKECLVRHPLAFATAIQLMQTASAATFNVSSEPQLAAAISQANAGNGPHSINLLGDITLTAALPPLLSSVTINGNNHSVSGGSVERIFFVGASNDSGAPRILVKINDAVLKNGLAQGGDGGAGGGGLYGGLMALVRQAVL